MKKIVLLMSTVILAAGIVKADTLAAWDFNTGATAAERLAASNAVAGVTVSGLSFNDLSTDKNSGLGFFNAQEGGGSVLPWHSSNGVATNYDGIGFGGNSGEQVMFLHRATFFDGDAVPNPRPTVDDYTSFGTGAAQGTTVGNGDGNAPVSFTVNNTGTESVNVVGLKVHITSGSSGLIFGIQEAGAAPGTTATVTVGSTATAYLSGGGVVVGSGQTKTLTINLDTGALHSNQSVNYFELLYGAGLAVGLTMPAVDGADIAMLQQAGRTAPGGADAVWGNQPAQGTTFTTGDNLLGYDLNSYTMQVDADTTSRTWTKDVRVVQVSSQGDTSVDATVRAYESAAVTGQFGNDASGSNFVTFSFSTPVHLDPNTVYGVDMGGSGWGFPPWIVASGNPYTGGIAYRSGANGVGNATLTYPNADRDRVFHLDIEALVGETIAWDNGDANGRWDTISANWTSGDGLFSDGDLVTFGDTGAGTVAIDGGNVAAWSATFANTTGNDYTIAAAAAETLAAPGGGIDVTGGGNVTISSVIEGATPIDHDGTGTLTLSAVNTFTGGITVRSGATFTAGNPSGDDGFDQVLGATSQATALTVEAGGTLDLATGANLANYGAGSIKIQGTGVGGNGAIVKATASGTVHFSGELDFTGDSTIRNSARMDVDGAVYTTGASDITITKNGGGALQANWNLSGASVSNVIVNQGAVIFEGNPINGTTLFTVNSGASVGRWAPGNSTTDGAIDLNGGALTSSGTDAVRTYTWSGDVSVSADSSVSLQHAAHIAELTGLLSGTNRLTLGQGTVRLAGDTSGYTGRVVFANANAILEAAGVSHTVGSLMSTASGLGTLRNESGTPAVLTVGADNTSSPEFSGVIEDGSAGGALSLVKTGSGTQILAGANTYSGDTTVNAGTLALFSGATLGTSTNVTVTAGKLELQGSGAIDAITDTATLSITSGQVQVASGANETVRQLYVDGQQRYMGTWGSTGSGASFVDNTHFVAGGGIVTVTEGPLPSAGTLFVIR